MSAMPSSRTHFVASEESVLPRIDRAMDLGTEGTL